MYSPSIGFTLELEDSKRLVGLSGIFIGVGEITGLYINKNQLILVYKKKIQMEKAELCSEFLDQKPFDTVGIP